MKRALPAALVLAAFALAFPAGAYAARPLSTEDAGVVDTGHAEAEVGFEYVKQADEEMNLSCVLKYGLVNNVDAGVEVPYHFIDVKAGDDVDGLGDVSVCAKYHLWDEGDTAPAAAVVFTLKTATGDEDDGLGSGELDYGLNTALTKGLGSVTAHANAGYTFVGGGEDVFSYGLAMEYPLSETVNIVGELTGETAFDGDFDENPCQGLVGLNWALGETVTLDVGVGFPISDASPDLTVTTGLTAAF